MGYGALKKRRDEVINRMLEIDAELKERKRSWIVDGVSSQHGCRAELEAELAFLALEKNRIMLSLHAEKKTEQAFKQATFTATLVRMLQERGLCDMVKEAERISADMMAEAFRKATQPADQST